MWVEQATPTSPPQLTPTHSGHKTCSSQWEVSKDDDYDRTGLLTPPAMNWPEADVTRKPALAFSHLS